jgi:hypothetical protein
MHQNLSGIVIYFVLAAFFIGCGFISWAYFDMSLNLQYSAGIYALILIVLTSILFLFYLVKAFTNRQYRNRYLLNVIVLGLSIGLFYSQAIAFGYIGSAIQVKIINKTGMDVTEAGLWGCSSENNYWGTLKNGESVMLRLQYGEEKTSCSFIVQYKIQGKVKREGLPMKPDTKNIYYLGTNHNEYDE